MIKSKQIVQALGLLGLLFITGCASPAYISKDFNAEKIGKVAFLPVLDARKRPDPSHDFKFFGGDASAEMISGLKYNQSYQVVHTTVVGDVADYSARIIEPSPGKYADAATIKQLGPPMAKWVMIPVCEDLNYWNALLAQGASAKISLYLFNKEAGELWWKGVGTGEQSGGVLNTLTGEAMFGKYYHESGAMSVASALAVLSLPKPKDPNVKRGRDYIYNSKTILTTPGLQKIAVTGTVDGRRRISPKVPYQPKAYQDEVIAVLRDKGFEAEPVTSYGQESVVTKEQIAFGGEAFGKSLAGMGSRYVMVPVADDMGHVPIYGKYCEASVYLFDTESGEIIWEGSGFGPDPDRSVRILKKGFPKRNQLPN